MPASRLKCFAAVCLVLAACLSCSAASAADPIDMHHTSWTAKDGAPSFVFGLAQTPDGWLWLAASSGLYRFDGVSFERVEGGDLRFPSHNLWGMRLLDSGALWIGYRSGGASVLQDGKVRNYGSGEGFSTSVTVDFEQDAAGRLWASTGKGLWLFDGQRWARAPAGFHAPTSPCTFLRDHARNLWAQCAGGAYKLAAGSAAFVRVDGPVDIGRLAQGPDQTVWSVGGAKADVVALAGPGVSQDKPAWPAPRYAGGTMLFERDGQHLWIVRDNGLVRHGPEGTSELFGMAQGLSGGAPNVMLQDREGNVWVGTENGLDRFRPQVLSGVPLPQVSEDSVALAAGPRGALWVGGRLLPTPDRGAFALLRQDGEKLMDKVYTLWSPTPGDTWIGAVDGVWHDHDGKREQLPLPPADPAVRRTRVDSIARDKAGNVWIALEMRGVFCWRDGTWHAYPELPRSHLLYADRDGRIWAAMTGGVGVVSDGGLRRYTEADGLHAGTVMQIRQVGQDIVISGENGLFRRNGDRFERIQGVGDESFYGVSGLLYEHDMLWLNGLAGISLIAGDEWRRALRDPDYRVRFRRLDHNDGLRGMATQSVPLPSAVAGSDALLWFATTAGVFWMSPDKLRSNTVPPPVEVLSILSSGVRYTLERGGQPRLPPLPARVQIDYTALSLTMPERVQFRYQLEGVDRDWQDAGTKRSIAYTDLAPGRYRFKVMAANNDGVWSREAATAQFVVEPTLYQTGWFRALAVLLLGAAIWGLYRWRLAQVDRQLRARFDERLDERERISRELHDTFLQTVHGLILKIHAVFQRLPADDPARPEMERSLEMAEQALSEGRDRVQGLRLSTEQQPELTAAVHHAVGSEYAGATRLVIHTDGQQRRLQPLVLEEVFAIAREALLNAAWHANATEVRFEVSYGPRDFSMTISDDGCGVDAEVLARGNLTGHFGMLGMHERAARIGATLTLRSTAGEGSRWHLTLPAKLAY